MSDFDGKFNYPDTTPYERRLYALNKELQGRIDKAIDYIPKIIISGKSEHSFNEFAVDFQQTKEGRMLLDILKGSDKE